MNKKKMISAIVFILMFSCLMASSAFAATTAFDKLSNSSYAKVFALSTPGRTIPYTDKNLITRGTVSYGASQNSYIENSTDEIYVYDVGTTNGKTWAYVSYPVSGGKRVYAYVYLDALCENNSSHATAVASGNFHCAKHVNSPLSSSYYVAKGDTVYLLSIHGSRYQIMYPSGNKYRIAFCDAADYNKYCSSNGNSSNNGGGSTAVSSLEAKIGQTIASIKNGSGYTKYYSSTRNLSAKGGYIGQCTWYAYGRFDEIHQIQLKTARHAKYWLSENANDSRVRVLNGASSIVPRSIAVRTSGTYGHVMFIEDVTYNSNGAPAYVYFTECNNDGNGAYNAGKDCVVKKLSYNDFVSQKKPAGYIAAR